MKENYNKKGSHLTQKNGLENKTDRLTVMMSKLATKDNGINKQFKPRYIKAKEEDRVEISMISLIMIEEIIRNRYRSNSEDKRIPFSGTI